MEHARRSLIVITLLQLCRAEISEVIPGTWFSANAINDGYSPKPLVELFSTDRAPGFSPTNPIVVLPTDSTPSESEVPRLSTTSSYTATSTQRATFGSSTPYPSTYESSTSFPSTISAIPSSSFIPSSSSYIPSTGSYVPSTNSYPISANAVTTPFPPPQNFPIFNFPSSPELPPNTRQTTLTGRETPIDTQTPSYDVIEQNSVTPVPPFIVPSSTPTPYLVIYQNTPESVANTYTTPNSFTETTSRAPILFPSFMTATQTKTTDGLTPFITNTYSDRTNRPTVTFRSTPPTTPIVSTTKTTLSISSNLQPCDPVKVVQVTNPTTQRALTVQANNPSTMPPPQVFPGPPNVPFSPKLKIRVIAPKGSITNIKINPSTTTKRPRKTKAKKSKNTHESCVDNCKGRREPICGIPLGTIIVETNILKGFPSICHMACHNSFKKDPYEKIVDGRCGKLRTRIIRVDVGKIHKEELKKSEYSIINTGPKTVVELLGSNVSRKH